MTRWGPQFLLIHTPCPLGQTQPSQMVRALLVHTPVGCPAGFILSYDSVWTLGLQAGMPPTPVPVLDIPLTL